MKKNLIDLTSEELCEMIQNKSDLDAQSALVLKNEGLVYKLSYKYAKTLNNNLDIEDLKQVARLGLLKAAKNYDASKRTSFGTYAYTWVKKYIFDEINENGFLVRIPSHKLEKIMKYSIHDDIDCDDREKVMFEKDILLTSTSLDTPTDDGHGTLIDLISSSQKSPEQIVQESIFKSSIHEIVELLDQLESKVITLRYGLNDGESHTVSETSRILNTTRDRVKGAEKRAIAKLREFSEARGLHDYIS